MIPEINSHSGAIFSEDRRYRYLLWRNWYWGWGETEPWLLFVGLNPSVANETSSDATVSQIIGRAKRLGYRGLLVCNVYAYVSTDPNGLKATANPTGPDNPDWIERAAKLAQQVWCGWGNAGGQKAEMVEAILRSAHPELYCIGTTKDGHPQHPRGIPLTEQPRLYIKPTGNAGIVPIRSEKARRAKRKAI
jgi:hypothetical protein